MPTDARQPECLDADAVAEIRKIISEARDANTRFDSHYGVTRCRTMLSAHMPGEYERCPSCAEWLRLGRALALLEADHADRP